MNKKLLIPLISGIAVAIILLMLSPMNQKPITISESINEKPADTSIPTRDPVPLNDTISSTIPITPIDFSYVDSNSIMKSSLASKGVFMSNALKISGDSTAKYCTFYVDVEKQNSIEYCTSTELTDSDNEFLGNIHMVGTMDSPDAVLGIIQTDPYMSNLDYVKTTYQIMVESLVCDCWQTQKPGNFESVSAWIDVAKSHHLEAKSITSSSKINGLAQKQLLLEVTTNTEGYLWKFIISN